MGTKAIIIFSTKKIKKSPQKHGHPYSEITKNVNFMIYLK